MIIEQITITPTSIPLAELAESWLLDIRASGKSKATETAYRMGALSFLRWHAENFPGTEPILDKGTCRLFLDDLRAKGRAPTTLGIRYTALRLFARWIHEEEETNPTGSSA